MNALLKLSARVLKSPLAGDRSLSDRRHSVSCLPLRIAAAAFLASACATWGVPAASAQITFAGAQYTINSGSLTSLASPWTANRNVFVSDFENGVVHGSSRGGRIIPTNPTIKTLAGGFGGTGYAGPGGVAVDADGNLFVTDPANNAVKEILAVNGSIPPTPTVKTVGSGFGAPWGIAVDGSGNVFVADTGNNAVKEILAAGGYKTVSTLGSGFRSPQGVAVDAQGNVYVADTLSDAAVPEVREMILAVNGSIPASTYTTITTLGSQVLADSVGRSTASGNVLSPRRFR